MPALTDRPTALYRCKDTTGRLLYVGVTTDPDVRFKRHEATAPWWPLVAERLVDWHPTRPAAEEAEATAIKDESPLYNRAGSDSPQALAEDFPVEREVSKNQLRLRLADVLHASAVEGRITYITSNGRRVAAIAPLAVAEARTT
ncbi:GIY-YIG nuclease family protein [Streptomyces sp. A1136]|uniref:GIY-YIG nuclease family protein n=1 Tax=Streptomyces sp. A1136 TaxID=2563102 RepID=UPI00109EB5A9|nr:GIY-YIG nuclease family protein [Streptomyces sp. A1136]THA44127.1 GIY-YIG nuclease family protein [Streptomyces sp. A1136]